MSAPTVADLWRPSTVRQGLGGRRDGAGRKRHLRPFPLEPLERLLVGLSGIERAERLGIHPRQLLRFRHLGLTVDQADALAVRLGRHPAEVWPDW